MSLFIQDPVSREESATMTSKVAQAPGVFQDVCVSERAAADCFVSCYIENKATKRDAVRDEIRQDTRTRTRWAVAGTVAMSKVSECKQLG
jgi:hypothetical protein